MGLLVKTLFGRVRRSASVRILLGLAVGQGAVLLLTPLLTRMYSPAEMGFAGTFLAAASIVGTVATFRLELLIPAASEGDSRWLSRMAMRSLLGVALIAVIGFALVARQPFVTALLFGLTVAGLSSVALTLQLAARQQRLGGVALSKAGQGIGQVGAQILAALAGLTAFGMQIGYAFGYLLSSGIQAVMIGRHPRSAAEPVPAAQKNRYWRQASILVLAAFLNITSVWIYPLLTQYLFGPVATGHLSVAQRFAVAPSSLVVASIAPVVVASVGANIRAGEPVNPIAAAWIRRLLPIAVVVLLVLLFVPRSWVEAVLGSEWGSVQDYLAAMSPMIAMQLLVGPLSLILVLKGRSKAQLVWDFSRLVVLVSVTVTVAEITRNPVAMIWSASAVIAIFYAIYLAIVFRARTDVRNGNLPTIPGDS